MAHLGQKTGGQNGDRLDSLCRPALMAAVDPAVCRQIDDFMWDYMGDPIIMDHLPHIERDRLDGNRYVYDEALEKGFTEEGSLVHVRRSLAGAALCRGQRYTHFVVTANLNNGSVTEWRINDVRHINDRTGLTTELVLTTDTFDVHDGEKEFEKINDPIRRELAKRAFVHARGERDSAQPRIILSSQGVWFSPPEGVMQTVYPVITLVRDQQVARQYVERRDGYEANARLPLPIAGAVGA